MKEYPAAEGSKGLLAVAATTQGDVRASYSNYGSWVPIGAPGDAILSSVPGNQWGAWSGTSMATPFVAGVAALVRSIDSALTPDEVTRHIVSTADGISGEVRLRVDAAAAVGVTVAEPTTKPMLYLPLLSRRTREPCGCAPCPRAGILLTEPEIDGVAGCDADNTCGGSDSQRLERGCERGALP